MESFSIKPKIEKADKNMDDAVSEQSESIDNLFEQSIKKGAGKYNEVFSFSGTFKNEKYEGETCFKTGKKSDNIIGRNKQGNSLSIEQMFLEDIQHNIKNSSWYEIKEVLKMNKINDIKSTDFIFSPKPVCIMTIDGKEYLIMQRIKGTDIDVFCNKLKELNELIDAGNIETFEKELELSSITIDGLSRILKKDFIKNVFSKIANIMLEKMHEGNMYHRDLHSGNVMIDFTTGMPVFIDFGESTVAFPSDPENEIYTTTIIVDGKPFLNRYIKDEQFLSEALTKLESYSISYINIIEKYNNIRSKVNMIGGDTL